MAQDGAAIATGYDEPVLVSRISGDQQLGVGDDGDFALDLCCLAKGKLAVNSSP